MLTKHTFFHSFHWHEEAPENGKESLHSVQDNAINEWNECCPEEEGCGPEKGLLRRRGRKILQLLLLVVVVMLMLLLLLLP
jgi:hypothetical protein